jgi:hypothetical protein
LLVAHALVLSGGGTEREVEDKNAFSALCPSTDVRLRVADLPAVRRLLGCPWIPKLSEDGHNIVGQGDERMFRKGR